MTEETIIRTFWGKNRRPPAGVVVRGTTVGYTHAVYKDDAGLWWKYRGGKASPFGEELVPCKDISKLKEWEA